MPEYDRACAGGGYRQNLDNLTTRSLNPSLQGPADSIPSHDLGQGSDDAFPQYPPEAITTSSTHCVLILVSAIITFLTLV